MMGLVHRCHPKKLQPTIIDLDQKLPSLKDVNISYIKLRELHTPGILVLVYVHSFVVSLPVSLVN